MKAVFFNGRWRIGNDQGRFLSKSIPYRGSYWLPPQAPKSVIRQYKSESDCKLAIKKIRPQDIRGNTDFKKIR
jgi:hypothetical protein